MRTARRHHRTGLLAGAALLLVLLGVLAMHGVGGGHTVGHAPLSASGPRDPVATGAAGHHVHGQTAPPGSVPHLAADVTDPAAGTALCLAILGGTVLLLLGTRTGVPPLLPPVRVVLGTRVPGRRDRDPPSLIALSVRRC